MDKSKYNEIVQSWMNEVERNCMKDAELTLKFCNDIIQYGMKTKDDQLVGYAHYYCGLVYYVLNDGNHFFEAITKALSYLTKADEYELMAKSYNLLGITSMSRGNAVIAADYYTNAIEFSKKANATDFVYTGAINIGALNLICGRYEEAVEVLLPAYEYYKGRTDLGRHQDYMLGVLANLSKGYLFQGKLKEAKDCFDEIHLRYEDAGDNYTMVIVLCNEAMYYHIAGEDEKCESNIARVHKATTASFPIMDMFEDLYDYCKVLLERKKEDEFWHIVELMEPMVKSLDITNLQLKLISLKIRFYRKFGKGAEYLQAAGLYYELSERGEVETRTMMNNVLNLRRNLEEANREKKAMEKENQILQTKSETDPLTKLNNRFRLNDASEEIFRQCLYDRTSLTVEILDIDDFKGYNDRYGHQMGDECLIKIAEAIKSMKEEHGAFVARYGGDEFILIYAGITKEEAVEYAQELRQKVIDKAITFKHSPVADVVTITQGLCWDVPVHGNRIWDYLHAADDMLYRMKKKQRNNYCIGNLKETEDQIIMSC